MRTYDVRSTSHRRAKAASAQPPQSGSLFPGVISRRIDSLLTNPRNARKHPAEQLHRLQKCISSFGFLVPVLIDEANNVILGHGRLMAAKQLGLAEIPTLTVSGLSSTQVRAFAIAENRLSDLANWDYDTLRLEFAELLDLQVDVEDTAFSTGEIDLILDPARQPDQSDDDVLPATSTDPVVTQTGDMWQLGEHILMCGDALEASTYPSLLSGRKASVVFTDPPYNVPIDGHVSGLGRVRHREFAMASGEMSSGQFTRFLATVFGHLARHSRRGSIQYVCMDWRHLREILAAGGEAYTELKNLCVWNKNNAGMGSFYRSKHELVLVFQNGAGRFQNNVALGATGRYRTNVWDYPGMTSMSKNRVDELALHPTVKPVALVADALRDSSKRGDLVLDPFCGSGTTLLAAHRTGRLCAGLEIDPLYVDVAIRRWEAMTKQSAVLASTGKPFSQMREERYYETMLHGRTSDEKRQAAIPPGRQ